MGELCNLPACPNSGRYRLVSTTHAPCEFLVCADHGTDAQAMPVYRDAAEVWDLGSYEVDEQKGLF